MDIGARVLLMSMFRAAFLLFAFNAFCAFAQDARLSVERDLPDGITISVSGQIDLELPLLPKKLSDGELGPESTIAHIVWSWIEGNQDELLASWSEEDQSQQKLLMTPERLAENARIASGVNRWIIRGQVNLVKTKVFFLERRTSQKPPEISLIPLVKCGRRWCQTNEPLTDQLTGAILDILRAQVKASIPR
jgi:hypothetical protein